MEVYNGAWYIGKCNANPGDECLGGVNIYASQCSSGKKNPHPFFLFLFNLIL